MPASCLSAKSRPAGFAHFVRALLGWHRVGPEPDRPLPRLDPRALSDHLKRDLGFLDGNDPGGPRR